MCGKFTLKSSTHRSETREEKAVALKIFGTKSGMEMRKINGCSVSLVAKR